MLKEFKEFVMRGNVLDLAIAVIIGGAFGKIIASLVGDILMPLIGLISGGIDFGGLTLTVGNATVKYGSFIQTVLDFILVAFTIFLIVKAANKLRKPAPAPATAPVEQTSKECPYCYSTISIKATRCPNCTSEVK